MSVAPAAVVIAALAEVKVALFPSLIACGVPVSPTRFQLELAYAERRHAQQARPLLPSSAHRSSFALEAVHELSSLLVAPLPIAAKAKINAQANAHAEVG